MKEIGLLLPGATLTLSPTLVIERWEAYPREPRGSVPYT
jgi:hypothetical protein